MKLLILDQYAELGGAQRMLLDLLPAIRAYGWCAYLGVPGAGPLADAARPFTCGVEAIHCGPYAAGRKSAADVARFLGDSPKLVAEVRGLARQFQPDVVYVNGPRLLPAVALASLGLPVVFHAHAEVAQHVVRVLAGEALARLDADVIAVCRAVADAWRQYAPGRTKVIYNGVAGPGQYTPRPPERVPVIGCVGRIAPEKGQKEFLAAAARIHRALPEARFVVCGAPLFGDRAAAGYERQVREAARDLPVTFTGWVDNVYNIMRGLDLLLVPSVWNEPNPRVILEAFSCGLPVIAFRAGGIPEIVEHGHTGFLCNDPGEMANVAIELLRNGGERLESAAREAREAWKSRFTLVRWQGDVMTGLRQAAQRGAGINKK